MAIKVKTVEDRELKSLQEFNSGFAKLKNQLGYLELQKQMIL